MFGFSSPAAAAYSVLNHKLIFIFYGAANAFTIMYFFVLFAFAMTICCFGAPSTNVKYTIYAHRNSMRTKYLMAAMKMHNLHFECVDKSKFKTSREFRNQYQKYDAVVQAAMDDHKTFFAKRSVEKRMFMTPQIFLNDEIFVGDDWCMYELLPAL